MQDPNLLRERLRALARNLWWTWHPEVVSIFADLDADAFRAAGHNPVAMLARLNPQAFEAHARNAVLNARIDQAFRRLGQYLDDQTHWGASHGLALMARPVTYFCAEFGLHESLPIYSGGLGVLAGDTLKSASDLGIPVIGVGLLYRETYFRQVIDQEGRQHAYYPHLNPDDLPMDPALGADGKPLVIEVPLGPGPVQVHVWRLPIGRTYALLLDTEVDSGSPELRGITRRLYGGDARTRLRQELVLGVGGMRALEALGIEPGVLHLNEGHAAFAMLELARQLKNREGCSTAVALDQVARRSVFTTHTPLEAGHDRFPPDLIGAEMEALRAELGLGADELCGLGRVQPQDPGEPFCPAVLALRHSRFRNAVSALHGQVARRMWQVLWPGRAADEVPIGHITNGVHVPSWLAREMHALFDRHLGESWTRRICHSDLWAKMDAVPEDELWVTTRVLKARLLAFVERWRREHPSPGLMTPLDPDAFTIGFARRFAAYKRADLLLRDPDRLARLLTHAQRPVQLIFAGKAHPADQPGQDVLAHIARAAGDERYRGRIVFLPDHDINVSRHLVQGVDMWLNLPRRPLEACGTSGQKATLNGVVQLSAMDGWWPEAYDGRNGFALSEPHADTGRQDARESESLYRLLEDTIVPEFYDRDANGVPRRWMARARRAIRTLVWQFNSDRMMMDYVRQCYLPAAGAHTSAT
jgi:glycogen phosphorylase